METYYHRNKERLIQGGRRGNQDYKKEKDEERTKGREREKRET